MTQGVDSKKGSAMLLTDDQRKVFGAPSEKHETLTLSVSGSQHEDAACVAIGETARLRAEELRGLGLLGAPLETHYLHDPTFVMPGDWLHDEPEQLCEYCTYALKQRGRWVYPLTPLGREVYESISGERATATLGSVS